MASHGFATTVTVSAPTPTGTRDSTWMLCSLRSYYDLVPSSALAANRTRSSKLGALNLRVRAMGGAPKFKGTQMKEKQLTEMIEKKVMEAKEVCEGDSTSDECKVAWDEVEEVSQAKADFRLKLEKRDPLEYFCQDNPETDECRIYED